MIEKDIKDILVAENIGVFGAATGWHIAIGKEPTEPDTAVTIYMTGGDTPSPLWLLDYPAIQVRIRGPKGGYELGRAKAQSVQDVLLGIPSQDIASGRLVSVTMRGGISFIGYDPQNRPLWTLNFKLITEPATSVESNRLAL